MINNADLVTQRKSGAPPRLYAPILRVQLLQLPKDVLQRVLLELVSDRRILRSQNLRDIWNVATTCTKLFALTTELVMSICPTNVMMEERVLHDVVTTTPDDVIQGALLALHCVGNSGSKSIRSVRLSAMAPDQLQVSLKRLNACSALTELGFVDAEGGVTVPKQLARRVKTLSIVGLRPRTLESIIKAGCAPKTMRLCCVDDNTAWVLDEVWEELTRESKRVHITWSGSLVRSYEDTGVWYLPVTDAQLLGMEIVSRRRNVPFGPLYASSMRSLSEEGERQNGLGWKTVKMSKWITNSTTVNSVRTAQRRTDVLEEEGVLTVVVESPSEAKQLLRDEGELMTRFVRQMVVGGDGHVNRLQVSVPLCCDNEDTQLTAKTAAQLVELATCRGGVRELAVSSLVFLALADISLPATVRSIGIVDNFTSPRFLRALPATLERLTRDMKSPGRRLSVGMQSMRLRDGRDALGTTALLQQAHAACRRAESDGLCVVGVRGVIDQWLRQRA